jgi:SOS-response transcriptional repressor LexA
MNVSVNKEDRTVSYAALLNNYIRKSGKTLEQISNECALRQVTVHPTYISKLRLGKRPAPSGEITRVLAEVTGGDPDKLLAEAGAERMSDEQQESYKKYVKNRMTIDFTLDKISEGNTIYPFVVKEIARLLTGQTDMFRESYPLSDVGSREKLAAFLADPSHDQDKLNHLLADMNALANSPQVLFEKLKASATSSGMPVLDIFAQGLGDLETYAVGQPVKIPIIGTVKAGPGGIAYEDFEGDETADEKDVKGGGYFYLRVKGDSMTGDGILPNDLALVRETPEIEYGDIAVVVIDGEEGMLKRVYKLDDGIMLHSSNPAYPPRVFKGSELDKVRIVGKVKQTIRKY